MMAQYVKQPRGSLPPHCFAEAEAALRAMLGDPSAEPDSPGPFHDSVGDAEEDEDIGGGGEGVGNGSAAGPSGAGRRCGSPGGAMQSA